MVGICVVVEEVKGVEGAEEVEDDGVRFGCEGGSWMPAQPK